MAIFKGSRYETVTEVTPIVDRPDRKVRLFLHNRKFYLRENTKTPFTIHEVVNGQLIDMIAYAYYGDERLWWLIADYNDLDYAWDLFPGQILLIPTKKVLSGIVT